MVGVEGRGGWRRDRKLEGGWCWVWVGMRKNFDFYFESKLLFFFIGNFDYRGEVIC